MTKIPKGKKKPMLKTTDWGSLNKYLDTRHEKNFKLMFATFFPITEILIWVTLKSDRWVNGIIQYPRSLPWDIKQWKSLSVKGKVLHL